jgi:hypothetical protein
MDRPVASGESAARYAEIAADLARRAGVQASSMFGMPTLKLDGRALAGLYGDAMVFKLDGALHGEAMALPGAYAFDPSGMGRPMKAWVVVPLDRAEDWARLAERTLAAPGD